MSKQPSDVFRRKAPKRVAFNGIDRWVFAGRYRLAPGVLDALKILKPETGSAGITPASGAIGAGNREHAVADRRHRWRFVSPYET